MLHFSPRLPEELKRVSFAMQFHGTPTHVSITHDELTLSVRPEGESRPIRVGLADAAHELSPGESSTFPLSPVSGRSETG